MIRSSFFNSVLGDRKYNALNFAEYFNSFIGNGVFPNPLNNLQVVSNDDMTVTVLEGRAWINGYLLINDDDYILNIDVADGVLKRIDRVVARLDFTTREIRVEVKKGTFASVPVAPTLQRDADAYELGIADILISNGVISIIQTNITDLRSNTEFCGKVDSLIAGDINSLVASLNEHKAEIGSHWTFIEKITLGVNATQLDIQMPTVYKELRLIGKDLRNDGADNTNIRIAFNDLSLLFYKQLSYRGVIARELNNYVELPYQLGGTNNLNDKGIFDMTILNSEQNNITLLSGTSANSVNDAVALFVFSCTDLPKITKINLYTASVGTKLKIGCMFEVWGR